MKFAEKTPQGAAGRWPDPSEPVNPLFLPFEIPDGTEMDGDALDLHARAIARMTRDGLGYYDAVALERHWPDPALKDHGRYALKHGEPVKVVGPPDHEDV